MTGDPKVVIQAHRLRAGATGRALLHGTSPARTRHGLSRSLRSSIVLAVIVVVVVLVTTRIIGLLQHTGR